MVPIISDYRSANVGVFCVSACMCVCKHEKRFLLQATSANAGAISIDLSRMYLPVRFMYTCAYMHVYLYVYMYIHVVHMHACMHLYMCVCVYISSYDECIKYVNANQHILPSSGVLCFRFFPNSLGST